jgi:hypothetical protein
VKVLAIAGLQVSEVKALHGGILIGKSTLPTQIDGQRAIALGHVTGIDSGHIPDPL